MRWDYPSLDINPVFPGLGEFFIIISSSSSSSIIILVHFAEPQKGLDNIFKLK